MNQLANQVMTEVASADLFTVGIEEPHQINKSAPINGIP